MAINITTDPRTRKQMILAEGKVDGVFFNELKEKKTYTGPKGQPWTPTHALSVVIDGVRVSLGLTEKDKLNAKDIDGNYHQIVKGVEVSAEVEENGEYKGVKQYQTKASKILVLDASGAVQPSQQQRAPQGSQNASGGFKKDNHEVVAGNARTAAFAFLKGIPYENVSDVNDLVQKFARYSDKKRKQYKEEHPELDDFQVGVSVGQAVVLAAPLAKDFDSLDVIVEDILGNVIPYSVGVVKGIASGSIEEEAPKQQEKSVQKPKVESKQQKVVEKDIYDEFDPGELPF